MPRTRHSLQVLQQKYDDRSDRSSLEKLVKAFAGIQALPPNDPKSFECIGGYHGLPFVRRPEGTPVKDWWGGYCWHGTVLFPTWHRAYLLELENALRSISGCEDVTLPFWDETLETQTLPVPKPIPSILTTPSFTFDPQPGEPAPGVTIPNPFFSYTLKQALDGAEDDVRKHRSTKPLGYSTVRYPQSGLVGTPEDSDKTDRHNKVYANQASNVEILNENVTQWLLGTVEIPTPLPPAKGAKIPDTTSIRARFHTCLDAPNYTVFSNTSSGAQWMKEKIDANQNVIAVESPHNAIHVALGGYYEHGVYHGSPIEGANGDIADNNVAAFDPIFFLHHCFIDYVFSVWQERHSLTRRGSLTLLERTRDGKPYPGTYLEIGQPPNHKPKDPLTMKTLLHPFNKSGTEYYTSEDVTDLGDLDIAYGIGSLDRFRDPSVPVSDDTTLSNPFVATQKVTGINRAQYDGSFVVRVYAKKKGTTKKVAVAREAILSRFNVEDCSNCRNHLDVEWYFPLDKITQDYLVDFSDQEDRNIGWEVEIQTVDRVLKRGGWDVGDWPKVEDL